MKNRILFIVFLSAAMACVGFFVRSAGARAAGMSEAQCMHYSGMCKQHCDTVEAGGSQKVIGTCITNNGVGEQNFCCAPDYVDINAPKPNYTDTDCADQFALCKATCGSTEAEIGSCIKGEKTLKCCKSQANMQLDPGYMTMHGCESLGGTCTSNKCQDPTQCIDLGMCYDSKSKTEKVSFCIKSTVPGVKTPTTESGTSGGTGGTKPPADSLRQLPCESSGNCTVDDIVQKGVAFAIFIMGLSGALFLLVFVYGGAMYVLSFGKSNWVDKGKNAMKQAVIGIVLVMGAWTIVYYVSKSIGYQAPSVSSGNGGSAGEGGSKGVCGTAEGTEGRTCMDINTTGKGKDCLKSYCPGAENIQCCK